MTQKTKKFIKILLFILAGCTVGYIYYKFWGCNGTCAISSSPYRSTIYGGIIGGLLSFVFSKE